MCFDNMLFGGLQMGASFGAPPAVMPGSFNAPVSGGLSDLFDLGGGVGMPMGAYVPPKTVSLPCDYYIIILLLYSSVVKTEERNRMLIKRTNTTKQWTELEVD